MKSQSASLQSCSHLESEIWFFDPSRGPASKKLDVFLFDRVSVDFDGGGFRYGWVLEGFCCLLFFEGGGYSESYLSH